MMMLSWARGGILCGVRHQTLRSLSSFTACESLRSTSDGINSSLKSLSFNADSSDDDDSDEINSLASFVTTKIDDLIKFGDPLPPVIYVAQYYVEFNYRKLPYTDYTRLFSMFKVVNVIKNFPEVDKIQIFHANIYYGSMLDDDSERELTKDKIIARVLNVIQSYPKVYNNEVTEETHFCKDLGLDKWDLIEIIQALQVEFKLDIPDDIVSCKLAIEHIYGHRLEKLCLEEFRKRFFFTTEFGKSKSEFRRIYLRAEEMERNDIMPHPRQDKIYTREPKWNGFNVYQYFRNMHFKYIPF